MITAEKCKPLHVSALKSVRMKIERDISFNILQHEITRIFVVPLHL